MAEIMALDVVTCSGDGVYDGSVGIGAVTPVVAAAGMVALEGGEDGGCRRRWCLVLVFCSGDNGYDGRDRDDGGVGAGGMIATAWGEEGVGRVDNFGRL